MTTLKATFSTTDNNSQDGINVWFGVTGTLDGDEDGLYALCVENNKVTALLDCDGCPCNAGDYHMAVVLAVCKEALTAEMINS